MSPRDVPYPKLSVPYALASGLYSSHMLPWAPGTAASLIAALLGAYFLSGFALFLGSLIWFFAGWWSVNKIEKSCAPEYHDASIFVADEWCGQWLLLAAAFYMWPDMPVWQSGLMAFVIFRLFDIVKPCPISAIDAKVSGGFGVMLDDVIAALMGGAVLFALSMLL